MKDGKLTYERIFFVSRVYVSPSSAAVAHPRDRLTAPGFARPPLRLSARVAVRGEGGHFGGRPLSCCLQLVPGVYLSCP